MSLPDDATIARRGAFPEPWSEEDFRVITKLLCTRQGWILPTQRLNLLKARLRVRLQASGFVNFTQFYDLQLKSWPNGPGMQLLVDLSTVNHTSFFREATRLRYVAEQLVERLKRLRGTPVRVWSAGCSAGQEPFSLAMDMVEMLGALNPDQVEVWASDLSLEMVRTAAKAIYNEQDLGHIPPDRLRRFFLRGRGPKHGTYRVVPEVRRLVKLCHFDLRSMEWPVPESFDAILCRNVAIYFAEDERVRLLDRLAQRLDPEGLLVVGNCEILPNRPGLLEKQAPSIFRKVAKR